MREARIRGSQVEFLEQPLHRKDWEGFADLSQLTSVPLMLNESIYDFSDIQRASQCGASMVKLKLLKHAGVVDLIRTAQQARELGLEVILGNGVASDIGNLTEGAVMTAYPGLFAEVGECNGFTRLAARQLANPPELVRGNLCWEELTGIHPWELQNQSGSERL